MSVSVCENKRGRNWNVSSDKLKENLRDEVRKISQLKESKVKR